MICEQIKKKKKKKKKTTTTKNKAYDKRSLKFGDERRRRYFHARVNSLGSVFLPWIPVRNANANKSRGPG